MICYGLDKPVQELLISSPKQSGDWVFDTTFDRIEKCYCLPNDKYRVDKKGHQHYQYGGTIGGQLIPPPSCRDYPCQPRDYTGQPPDAPPPIGRGRNALQGGPNGQVQDGCQSDQQR